MPTVASTVVRSADVLSITSLPFYNQAAGTLYAEFDAPYDAVATGGGTIANFSFTGSFNDSISFNQISTTSQPVAQVITGGVTQASLSDAAMAQNVVFKAALAYATNDTAFIINNGTLKTDTSATLPTVSLLVLGPLGGHLRKFTYSPTRQANAALGAMTT
jgi:hypothetical protein